MSDYLALLRRSGKVEDPESGGKPSMPLNRAALAAMRERMAVVERQSRPGGELLSPRERPGSWRVDTHIPLHVARRVIMKVTGVGIKEVFVIGGLTPTSTVQVLIDHVHRRLQPGPSSQIIVEHYGRVLPPERTLAQCSLQDDAKLGVRVVERRPMGDRGLRRLRVVCTALCTRTITIDNPTIKGLAFKELLEASIGRPGATSDTPYEFWDAEGECLRVANGQTVVAIAEKAEDEAAGTSAVSLGEELVMDSFQSASLRGGKGTVTARRMLKNGAPCTVSAEMVEFLDLTPQKMQLTFGGVEIRDIDALYALGCRTDDVVHLEFESPCVPPILALVRAPAPEKKDKGGKGKKKKKKKKL